MSTPTPAPPFTLRLAYGLPAFALAVVGIPIYVYLPKFYTDTVGVPVATIGTILFGVRIFDAFTDPAIGFASDRTITRFGRRRPYIAVGAVLLALTILLLFNPPALTPSMASLWFAGWIVTLFLFWTVVTVPYESLGPEITFDYHQRTSLFALRDGLLIAGTLFAAALPGLLEELFSDGIASAADDRRIFSIMSLVYAPLVVVSCLLCVRRVRERYHAPRVTPPPLTTGLSTAFRNRPFVILLAAYTVSAIGSNLPATLILYYVQYVLQTEGASLFLLAYFLFGILLLPGWIRLSRRIGKKRAWLLSMGVNTGAFAGVFLLGAGDTVAYVVLICISGIGFGASLALPSAIQADVIDVDELLTGSRREGIYIGLWSIAKKLAAAAGVGIALVVLGSAGYAPNAVQNETVVFTLRVLYALVPCLCNLAAIAIAAFYPIDENAHAEIRRRIDGSRQSVSSLPAA